jgi:hypothetical protein
MELVDGGLGPSLTCGENRLLKMHFGPPLLEHPYFEGISWRVVVRFRSCLPGRKGRMSCMVWLLVVVEEIKF